MYKLLFIDEQQNDIDDFKDYVDQTSTSENFAVEFEYPLEDLTEMIQLVISHDPDAIIVDYMLNEYKESIKHNVPYNGVELVQAISAIREGFPCFVMTSFDDQAVKSSQDVNIVYIKDILHFSENKTQAKANFLERVESQILHYKAKLKYAEDQLTELLKLRSQGRASLEQESEIIRLDQLLEKAIDKRNAIPEEYKDLSNITKLSEIISKVDEILKKVNNGK